MLEFLKPGIRRPIDLTKGLGIAPFATLPYLRSQREITGRTSIIWGGVAAVLVVIAAALWLVHTRYMPLDLLFEQMRRKLG